MASCDRAWRVAIAFRPGAGISERHRAACVGTREVFVLLASARPRCRGKVVFHVFLLAVPGLL